jgi:hypothetical protein
VEEAVTASVSTAKGVVSSMTESKDGLLCGSFVRPGDFDDGGNDIGTTIRGIDPSGRCVVN